ncbi:MAG: hypothetical protein KF850_05030 [Labilithrix sp.]|nr:hypothetical protein [Labilithrix sp.]
MSRRRVLTGVVSVAAGLLAGGEARAETVTSVPDPDVRHAPLPDTRLGFQPAAPRPTLAWAAFQLVPSPEIAVGRQRHVGPAGEVEAGPRAAFGLRWQLTPVLWSFGVHPSQSRWRTFVVDPIARQSGSIELSTSFEYIGGHVDRLLARPGLRVYLPVAHKGEYLSVSLGTSVYAYEGLRVAYDVGAYILAGTVGFQMTVAPAHAPLAGIATLRLRYF